MLMPGGEPIADRCGATAKFGGALVNDPMDVFEYGEDMVIEIVELSGVAEDEPCGGVEITGTSDSGMAMGNGVEMESDGVGTRSPAPKGNGAGPSVRP